MSMKKNIIVIGATGLVGRAVTEQLSRDGNNVILLSRDREKALKQFPQGYEIIEGDVLDPNSIKQSFNGVDGIFISLPETIVSEALPTIIQYSKTSSVKQIVYVSGCTVRKENAWHPMIKGHYEAEMALEQGGVSYTILKPTMIMDTIPQYAHNGKPFIIGQQPHAWSWIHTSDMARMASAAFSNEKAKNKRFTLWGSEKETFSGAIEKFNMASGLDAKPVKPKPYWMANLLALMVGQKLKYAIGIFRYFDDHPEEGDPTETYALLGKPQMDLQKFFNTAIKH